MSSIWWWKERFLWPDLLIKQRDMRTWCSSFKRLFRMQVKMSPRKLKNYPMLDWRIWLQSYAKSICFINFSHFLFEMYLRQKPQRSTKSALTTPPTALNTRRRSQKSSGFILTTSILFYLFKIYYLYQGFIWTNV